MSAESQQIGFAAVTQQKGNSFTLISLNTEKMLLLQTPVFRRLQQVSVPIPLCVRFFLRFTVAISLFTIILYYMIPNIEILKR